MIRTYPPTSKGRDFEKWTKDVAVARKLEDELRRHYRLRGKITKLQTATWMENGVEIEIWGHQTPFGNFVCPRERRHRSPPGERRVSVCTGKSFDHPTERNLAHLAGSKTFPLRHYD